MAPMGPIRFITSLLFTNEANRIVDNGIVRMPMLLPYGLRCGYVSKRVDFVIRLNMLNKKIAELNHEGLEEAEIRNLRLHNL